MNATTNSPQQIRGVLFDLDNTLHDRDEAFVAWAREFITDKLGVRDPDELQEVLDLIVAMDLGGAGDKLALFEALRKRYPLLTQSPRELLDSFFASRTDYMRLSDNANALFRLLGERRVPWGIVTNGGAEQWDKLRAMGLDSATPVIVVSHDIGISKPDPDVFRTAASRLQREPGEILFVGDHPVADIVGADAIGMMTAWMHRGRAWPAELAQCAPGVIINDLGDLLMLF